MTPRRKKSRKRSAANSTAASRLEQAVFYLDESIFSRVLLEAMREAGAFVQHAGGILPFGTPDEQWLTACGEKGWIALTRDQHIRRRLLEKRAFRAAGVAAFAFTAGQATATETAAVVVRLLRKFVNTASSEQRPFLFTFGLTGKMTRIANRDLR